MTEILLSGYGPVSRETHLKLRAYVDLLRHWQKRINLVSSTTLADAWARHICDSAQALAAMPTARRWADLGSGAGLPGLVTAILLSDCSHAEVTLFEANRKKCAFLNTVIRTLDLKASVRPIRIESVAQQNPERVDAVSARAVAPLPKLLDLASPFLLSGATGIFHKGLSFDQEKKIAAEFWQFDLREKMNLTQSGGIIAVVSNVRPRH